MPFFSAEHLSAPDATYIPTSLPPEQAANSKIPSMVIRIQQKEHLVLCTVTSRLLVSIYCLPSTELVQICLPSLGPYPLTTPYLPDIGRIKMASASTPSANEPAKDFILVHTVQLKPMIKLREKSAMTSAKEKVAGRRWRGPRFGCLEVK